MKNLNGPATVRLRTLHKATVFYGKAQLFYETKSGSLPVSRACIMNNGKAHGCYTLYWDNSYELFFVSSNYGDLQWGTEEEM